MSFVKARPIYQHTHAQLDEEPRLTGAWGCPRPGSATEDAVWRRTWPALNHRLVLHRSGQFVTITGADEDGKKWVVKGQTNGRDLLLDFSPKGGPPQVLAKADSLGIRFPDGNVWTKLL